MSEPWGRDATNNSNSLYLLQEVFNIQVPYDVNQVTKPESWDGVFHPISLYGSFKYLSSDSKNIKESLHQITIYIKNKEIDHSKANNISDLNSIGKVVWNFISVLYGSGWNALNVDSAKKSFRQLVSFKFTLRIHEVKKPSKSKKFIDKPASIERLPSPISAKTQKKVNEISKYFKKNTNKTSEKKDIVKSYTQVSVPSTSEILKIKKVFPKLQTSKINNIHKIVSESGKPKPKLNMTTKDPSRKQIIILMSIKNRNKFMESLSSYITNLNRMLRSIKLEVMADFVGFNHTEIMIVTNKIITSLDLQNIEKYVKEIYQIDLEKVKVSRSRKVDLVSFYFFFLILFSFQVIFLFSIFRT